jgi:hypothetical protein
MSLLYKIGQKPVIAAVRRSRDVQKHMIAVAITFFYEWRCLGDVGADGIITPRSHLIKKAIMTTNLYWYNRRFQQLNICKTLLVFMLRL